MTFGVTSEGFKAKRFTDIVTELGEALSTQLNIDINSDPDSVAKVLTNIYALALSEEWALPQALQSMFDIDKAEGKHLDDLVGYVGISRLQAVGSNGNVYVTGNKILTIPSGSTFQDTNSNTYSSNNTLNVSPANYVSLKLDGSGAANGSTYTFTVSNGTTTSSLSRVVSTPSVTLPLLASDINIAAGSYLTASVIDSTTLLVVSDDDKVSLLSTYSGNLTLTEVISFGLVTRDTVGALSVPVSTVTTAPSISGITGTTNRYAFTLGREEESDIDLRNRHSLSLSTAGSATVDAIRADLLRVEGVTTAIVIENDTLALSVDNIPPKAFLCIVKGGEEQAIGDALWLTKGAGIETAGNITVVVVDSRGENQTVNFSRATQQYIWIDVDYTLYDEQSSQFPTNGEALMKSTCVSYGGGLAIGEDVIPQRFSTEIFNSVGGLATANVSIGVTQGEFDPKPAMSTAIIPISAIQESAFDTARITVTEV